MGYCTFTIAFLVTCVPLIMYGSFAYVKIWELELFGKYNLV